MTAEVPHLPNEDNTVERNGLEQLSSGKARDEVVHDKEKTNINSTEVKWGTPQDEKDDEQDGRPTPFISVLGRQGLGDLSSRPAWST